MMIFPMAVVHFPVSGVECSLWLPPLAAFLISSITASAGVSGAILLLPFQVNVLGFTTPAVSATNLVYNTVAVPGGVYRFVREGRMLWPLAWTIVVGTLPGMLVGVMIRVRYLPDPALWKVFVGLVLLYIGARLLWESLARPRSGTWQGDAVGETPWPGDLTVRTASVSTRQIEYGFAGQTHSFRPGKVLAVSLAVGLVGGIYGIGGGAIIAPFLAAFFGLPVYTVAGAALFGTLLTSAGGVLFFEMLGLASWAGTTPVRPDWALGALFGVGGLFGTYVGARMQKYLPERWLRLVLGLLSGGLALHYAASFAMQFA